MNKTKNAAIFLILILSMVLSACSAAQGAGAVKLEGTQWTLVSYGPVGSQTPALPDVKTALSFEKDGRLGGTAGCNGFGGAYRQNGQKLTIGELMQTEMACEGEGIMQQEASVVNMLATVGSFSVQGQQLTLTSADGKNALIYTQASK